MLQEAFKRDIASLVQDPNNPQDTAYQAVSQTVSEHQNNTGAMHNGDHTNGYNGVNHVFTTNPSAFANEEGNDMLYPCELGRYNSLTMQSK